MENYSRRKKEDFAKKSLEFNQLRNDEQNISHRYRMASLLTKEDHAWKKGNS